MWRRHLSTTVQIELQKLFAGTTSQPSLSTEGLPTMAVSAVTCSFCVHLAVSTCIALSYTCVDTYTRLFDAESLESTTEAYMTKYLN